MSFFMFVNKIAILLVSTQFVSTLKFQDPIEYIASGKNKMDLFYKVSRDKKTLVIKSLSPSLDTNMVVLTTKGSYSFDVRTSRNPHKLVIINDGKKDQSFRELKNTSQYMALEGESSLSLKAKRDIDVNGLILKKGEALLLPKGSPVFINFNREIY